MRSLQVEPHTVYERMYQLSLQGTELDKIERRLQAPELLQKGSRPRTPSCKCWSFPVEDRGDSGAILAQSRGRRISQEMWVSKLAWDGCPAELETPVNHELLCAPVLSLFAQEHPQRWSRWRVECAGKSLSLSHKPGAFRQEPEGLGHTWTWLGNRASTLNVCWRARRNEAVWGGNASVFSGEEHSNFRLEADAGSFYASPFRDDHLWPFFWTCVSLWPHPLTAQWEGHDGVSEPGPLWKAVPLPPGAGCWLPELWAPDGLLPCSGRLVRRPYLCALLNTSGWACPWGPQPRDQACEWRSFQLIPALSISSHRGLRHPEQNKLFLLNSVWITDLKNLGAYTTARFIMCC